MEVADAVAVDDRGSEALGDLERLGAVRACEPDHFEGCAFAQGHDAGGLTRGGCGLCHVFILSNLEAAPAPCRLALRCGRPEPAQDGRFKVRKRQAERSRFAGRHYRVVRFSGRVANLEQTVHEKLYFLLEPAQEHQAKPELWGPGNPSAGLPVFPRTPRTNLRVRAGRTPLTRRKLTGLGLLRHQRHQQSRPIPDPRSLLASQAVAQERDKLRPRDSGLSVALRK
ncbi:hypothetical protein REJC140_02322 [Pseudorhizobium endolithicum]|uniref:Uncharacterized protein n=1 Tax=Pseudorhizobium endolithicum TaxID=1191678 RepID=A0ABM8PYY2_9HYPH|nr:hypothetical protein REJC140_02322 [Pseudorhizobium endolithicum]